MVILDTNVLSALMLREQYPHIVAWFDEQPFQSVWITAVTVYEIRFGLELLREGRRRSSLQVAFGAVVEEDLDGRILPFDTGAAHAAGRIGAMRRSAGRPVEIRDVQIAGIAAVRKATLATRNTRHFADIGLNLVDPWAS